MVKNPNSASIVNGYFPGVSLNLALDMENTGRRHRSKLDIVRDILQVAEEAGEACFRKTLLMYGANLSYELLTRYLEEVLNAGLIGEGAS